MASPDVDKDLAAKVVMQNMVRPATFNAQLRPVHLARVVPASDRAPTRRDVHRTFSRRSAFPRARQKKSLLLRRALIPAPRLPLSSCLAADQHRSRMDLPQRRVRVRCRGEPRDGPHSRLGAPPVFTSPVPLASSPLTSTTTSRLTRSARRLISWRPSSAWKLVTPSIRKRTRPRRRST